MPCNQNVLLIGSGVSSTDIAREIGPEAKTIFQTSRDGAYDLPSSLLPPNAKRVSDISHFEERPRPTVEQLDDALKPLPGRIFLRDGLVLDDIHRIVVCTGYHFSLPFLPDYHSDDTQVHEANDTVLVTNGTQIHNLHKDIFYIPDPTLLFIGVPYHNATFTFFEFQAMVAAAVLSKRAVLPSEEKMRAEYRERVKKKGTGRAFHSTKDTEVEYVNDLLQWVNGDAAKIGADPIHGHTKAWHAANVDRLERLKTIFGRG